VGGQGKGQLGRGNRRHDLVWLVVELEEGRDALARDGLVETREDDERGVVAPRQAVPVRPRQADGGVVQENVWGRARRWPAADVAVASTVTTKRVP
jgi:hypothetical protein